MRFRGLKEEEHKNWVTKEENIWNDKKLGLGMEFGFDQSALLISAPSPSSLT